MTKAQLGVDAIQGMRLTTLAAMLVFLTGCNKRGWGVASPALFVVNLTYALLVTAFCPRSPKPLKTISLKIILKSWCVLILPSDPRPSKSQWRPLPKQKNFGDLLLFGTSTWLQCPLLFQSRWTDCIHRGRTMDFEGQGSDGGIKASSGRF